MALLGGSRSLLALAGVSGGAIGYYVTTLRYDAGKIIQAGGQAYKVGNFIGIYLPSDKLFDPNTADLLPQAETLLQSAATILKRYPNNNILVSGNTSGFARTPWERRLAEKRAQQVAAALWNAGISQFKDQSLSKRQLTYVGYGDFFPVAGDYTNKSIRQNSRIQITSYPSTRELGIAPDQRTLENVGAMNDVNTAPTSDCGYKNEC